MTDSIQRRTVRKPAIAALMALLSICLGSQPAAARSSASYGPAVDTYCRTYDGSTPYQTNSCALCHVTGNYATPKGSTWDWYSSGVYSPFCTGTPANRAPNGTIVAPTGDLQIAVGGTAAFQGTGTDPDGNALIYRWNFGVSTATGPGPHVVAYPSAGTYTATLTVSDGTLDDPTPATRVVTVQVPTTCTDADADGFSVNGGNCGPVDCNDSDRTVNPNASEICSDGIDNNCDGRIDSADPLALGCGAACLDSDSDGFSPDGGICGPEDCDDTDPQVNPGAREICNDRIDNDCNDYLDDTDRACNGKDCLARLAPVLDLSPRASSDPSRDPAAPLDGLTVSGTLFVFVPEEPGITGVRFYLDERLVRTVTRAPWDMAGSSSQGAGPFNTRTLTNGWHALRTEIDVQGSRTEQSNAAFLVQNLVANRAPTCTIDAPTGNLTVNAGQSVTFAGTGIDTDGDVPLAYAWGFGGAAAASSAQDPGAVRFSNVGTFAVSFTATDSAGLSCTNPATVRITVQAPSDGGSFTAHPITANYVTEGHKSDWRRRPSFCATCHGADLKGTAASATFAARAWPSDRRQPDGSKIKRYAKGAIVGCVECHRAPEREDGEDDD